MTMSNQDPSSLPPGFRFHPTDEELILHYLRNKSSSLPCPVSIIADVNIYKFNPWDLPSMAVFGDKEWYFFTTRDRKYPNGTRPNRAARSGYWKATGTDKPIVTKGRVKIGVKKALVFYVGKPPKGRKTNWVMHEYRLDQSLNGNSSNLINHNENDADISMRLDDWILCRIYEKTKQSNCSFYPQSMVDKEGEHEPDDKNIDGDLGLPSLSNLHQESIDSRFVKVASLTEIFRDADSDLYRILYNNNNQSENQVSFQTYNCNGINISGNARSIRTEPPLIPDAGGIKRHGFLMEDGLVLLHQAKKRSDNGIKEDINFNSNNMNNNYQLPTWNQSYLSQNQFWNSNLG